MLNFLGKPTSTEQTFSFSAFGCGVISSTKPIPTFFACSD